MSRKKLMVLALSIVCIFATLIAVYALTLNPPKSTENPTPSSIPKINTFEEIPDSVFVVPEIPIGTLGLISAMATAIGVFATAKMRKKSK